MKPLVSVILPVYNGKKTLQYAIDSLLSQTLREFELLIIDDGSTDSTKEIVESLDDPRLILFSNAHSGLASSLNYGIREASAKYVARMDADDICLKNRLALQFEYMENHPEIDLLASKVKFRGPAVSEGFRLYVEWQNQLISHSEIYLNRFVDSPLVHPSVMLRRSSIIKYGHYEENNGPEDFELWLRWLDKGAVFHKLQDELLVWVDHPYRLTRVDSNYHQDKFFKLKARYFAKWYLKNHQVKSSNIWIIGAGRNIYQRTAYLMEFGLKTHGYIDFKPKLSTDRIVISYQDIPSLENPFFLSYVRDRLGRIKVGNFLKDSGYREGHDFYMMA